MMRSRVINGIGAVMSRHGAGRRAGHQVHPRRRLRDRGDGRAVRASCCGIRTPLRPGARRARGRRGRHRAAAAALAGARDRAGLQDPQADPARAGLRPGHPPVHARGDHRQRRARRDQGAAGRVGPPRHPGAAQGPRLARTARSPARSSTTSSRSARGNPRDVVVVYIPEYVVGHWWEQVLHNQSALRLKGRLLFTPGVMVASVPWQLALGRGHRGPARRPGRRRSVRRGE